MHEPSRHPRDSAIGWCPRAASTRRESRLIACCLCLYDLLPWTVHSRRGSVWRWPFFLVRKSSSHGLEHSSAISTKPIIFFSDADDGCIADIADLKVCSGDGDTAEEALAVLGLPRIPVFDQLDIELEIAVSELAQIEVEDVATAAAGLEA